jgi:hypothetical protein
VAFIGGIGFAVFLALSVVTTAAWFDTSPSSKHAMARPHSRYQ